MTTLLQWMTWIPSFALGAVVMGFVGLPLAKRRGVELGKEEQRVLDYPALIQDTPAITAAPADALPKQFGTLHEHRRRLPVTANLAPTDSTPAVALDWPLRWRLSWPVLVFVARFWWTPPGVAIDRLWVRLARHERRWWRDYPVGAHRSYTAPLGMPFVALVPKLRRMERVS